MSLFRTPFLSLLMALGTSSTLIAAHAEADVAKDAKPYPFETCAVSGEAFGGDMGDPYVFVHEGQEIKLCCKGCVKQFKKEPAVFLHNIDEGIKAKAAGKTPVNPKTAPADKNDHTHGKEGHKDAEHKKDGHKDGHDKHHHDGDHKDHHDKK